MVHEDIENAAGAACIENVGEWDELTPEELRVLEATEPAFKLPFGGPSGVGKAFRVLRQQERRATSNYLLSIYTDASFVECARTVLSDALRSIPIKGGGPRAHDWKLPLLANLRAGAWYVPPNARSGTCYFKSTDGHYGHWDVSLTRLNFHVAQMAADAGCVLIVDSTRRGKEHPDSFTRTLPIWCAAMSAIALDAVTLDKCSVGSYLSLPPWVNGSERDQIARRLPEWVRRLLDVFPADAQPELFRKLRGLPLRPVWLSPQDSLEERTAEIISLREEGFPVVVCISASRTAEPKADREFQSWAYIQGAGDDDEAWAQRCRVTPKIFWDNAAILVSKCRSDPESVDAHLAVLASAEGDDNIGHHPGPNNCAGVSSVIPGTGLALGDFDAAAQPMVWERFGAVINCGDTSKEHLGMSNDARYLHVPAVDGKKGDASKNWWQEHLLPKALSFAHSHLFAKESSSVGGLKLPLLICCNRGDTRAPAVAAAIMAAFGLLAGRADSQFFDLDSQGTSQQQGRKVARTPVTKVDLRRHLVAVQRYHPFCAVPRRIMQQLNLFFISTGGGWSLWVPCQPEPSREQDVLESVSSEDFGGIDARGVFSTPELKRIVGQPLSPTMARH